MCGKTGSTTIAPDVIIARCVFDASGDYPGTSRSAFPPDTDASEHTYGADFTDLLIEEANKTRAMRGYGPKHWVYKGYGIFQYDLQFVTTDRSFFEQKQWYDFDKCLQKLMEELRGTWSRVDKHHTDASSDEKLRLAIQLYNGSGAAAEHYSENAFFTSMLHDRSRDLGDPVFAFLADGTRHAIGPPIASLK